MDTKVFWEKIDYSNDDYIKGEQYIKLRGLDAHLDVYNYLLSFTVLKLKYSQIATAMRYEKRIRRIIYKYIGFFEEYIRAYIANKYRDDISNLNINKSILKNYIAYGNNLFMALNDTTIKILFDQVNNLTDNEKKELFDNISYTYKSIDAIRVLRNQVSHNRFLLNNKKLSAPTSTSTSLYSNVVNLYNYLPKDIRDTFKKEINNAKLDHKESKDYQTNWDIIDDMVIELN